MLSKNSAGVEGGQKENHRAARLVLNKETVKHLTALAITTNRSGWYTNSCGCSTSCLASCATCGSCQSCSGSCYCDD